MTVKDARPVQRAGRVECGVGAAHEDVAVGKVDHPQNPVDHRVAEREQRIHAALRQAEDNEVQPDLRRIAARSERAHRAPHYGPEDHDAENPQEPIDDGKPLEPVPMDAYRYDRRRHRASVAQYEIPRPFGAGSEITSTPTGGEPEAPPQLTPQISSEVLDLRIDLLWLACRVPAWIPLRGIRRVADIDRDLRIGAVTRLGAGQVPCHTPEVPGRKQRVPERLAADVQVASGVLLAHLNDGSENHRRRVVC